MGLIKATIYVDSSFGNEGLCCSGYIITLGKKEIKGRSCTFTAQNNNDAEIKGIVLATEVLIAYVKAYVSSEDNHYDVRVYNDNIVATSVTDSKYMPSKKAVGKFQSTADVQAWCLKNNVTFHCTQKNRCDPTIKICDKLSKAYRKEAKRRWRKK